ncbi:MAG: hypothetical protein IGS49_20015 [Chlorogloeopsis fritschii C42_A2020_084]|uniref:hypothetical protein n=1 Tax=Chlorogloeopsis fritschii TaxID=1124 RepID=UPI0019EB2753|nr:hypothetical protein [Chlorogloeopsis fritschii]MBF2007673.1 hypothetical protein [Chlorogloeopsis fritschii C42_A2020_084]
MSQCVARVPRVVDARRAASRRVAPGVTWRLSAAQPNMNQDVGSRTLDPTYKI